MVPRGAKEALGLNLYCRLLVQQWTLVRKGAELKHKAGIEQELHRFERFQNGA